MVKEDALEREIEQEREEEKEKNTIEIINNMFNNNIALDYISDNTGKSIDEIKKIEESMKD